MGTISIEELTYLRNILALSVGDKIQWCLNEDAPNHHTSALMCGAIIAIYPKGKRPYLGMEHAFMVVRDPTSNYSVSLINPTIRKLETDK